MQRREKTGTRLRSAGKPEHADGGAAQTWASKGSFKMGIREGEISYPDGVKTGITQEQNLRRCNTHQILSRDTSPARAPTHQ